MPPIGLKRKLAEAPAGVDFDALPNLPLPSTPERFYEREVDADGSMTVREWTLSRIVKVSREDDVKQTIAEVIEQRLPGRVNANERDAIVKAIYDELAATDSIKQK